jgi:hypothetical protein
VKIGRFEIGTYTAVRREAETCLTSETPISRCSASTSRQVSLSSLQRIRL